MNIYGYSNYKVLLKELLLEKKKHVGSRFTFQKMAAACRVQKTYLSKVLNSNGDLSADQLFWGCEYLGLDNEQTEYIFLLFEENRCQAAKRKALLKEKIGVVKKKFQQTDAHVQAEVLGATGEEYGEFFLDPYLQLIVVFFTIENYRKNPALIRDKLELTEEHFSLLIDKLLRMKFLALNKGRYDVLKESVHLSSSSYLNSACKIMLRVKALEKAAKLSKDKFYSFSVVFATDLDTKEKVQQSFFDFLKKTEKLTRDSVASEIYQMNFDLLPWS